MRHTWNHRNSRLWRCFSQCVLHPETESERQTTRGRESDKFVRAHAIIECERVRELPALQDASVSAHTYLASPSSSRREVAEFEK